MLNYAKNYLDKCFKYRNKKVFFWILCILSLSFLLRQYTSSIVKSQLKCNEVSVKSEEVPRTLLIVPDEGPTSMDAKSHSVYRIPVNVTVPTWESLNANTKVSQSHVLNNNAATNAVAVIIPYRDRESHLRVFLQHMHPFLQKQKLAYRIYIIEQKQSSVFNRAMLMNIGFVESLKIANYAGFGFHDVDLLPRDSRISYGIPNVPTHMSPAYDKFSYSIPYYDFYGGVTSFSKEDCVRVNGFSNQYYGWGGEDDDLYLRVLHSGFNITRYDECIGQYIMILHEDNRQKLANPQRCNLLHYLEKNKESYKNDGLNTLKYTLIQTEHHKLYTNMLVDIDNRNITSFGGCSSASIVRINYVYLTFMLAILHACCSNVFFLFDSDCI